MRMPNYPIGSADSVYRVPQEQRTHERRRLPWASRWQEAVLLDSWYTNVIYLLLHFSANIQFQLRRKREA